MTCSVKRVLALFLLLLLVASVPVGVRAKSKSSTMLTTYTYCSYAIHAGFADSSAECFNRVHREDGFVCMDETEDTDSIQRETCVSNSDLDTMLTNGAGVLFGYDSTSVCTTYCGDSPASMSVPSTTPAPECFCPTPSSLPCSSPPRPKPLSSASAVGASVKQVTGLNAEKQSAYA